jgi:hypothetical protein
MQAERNAAAPSNSPAPSRPCALAFQLFSSRNDTAAGATAVSAVPPSIVTCGAEAPSNLVRSRDQTRSRARMPSAPPCSPPPASKLRIKKALPTRQWHPIKWNLGPAISGEVRGSASVEMAGPVRTRNRPARRCKRRWQAQLGQEQKVASSAESVGEDWLGEVAELVIQG